MSKSKFFLGTALSIFLCSSLALAVEVQPSADWVREQHRAALLVKEDQEMLKLDSVTQPRPGDSSEAAKLRVALAVSLGNFHRTVKQIETQVNEAEKPFLKYRSIQADLDSADAHSSRALWLSIRLRLEELKLALRTDPRDVSELRLLTISASISSVAAQEDKLVLDYRLLSDEYKTVVDGLRRSLSGSAR